MLWAYNAPPHLLSLFPSPRPADLQAYAVGQAPGGLAVQQFPHPVRPHLCQGSGLSALKCTRDCSLGVHSHHQLFVCLLRQLACRLGQRKRVLMGLSDVQGWGAFVQQAVQKDEFVVSWARFCACEASVKQALLVGERR